MGFVIPCCLGLVLFTGCYFGYRLYERYHAVKRLIESVDSETWVMESTWFDDPVADVKKWRGDDWAVAALIPRLMHSNQSVRWSAAHVLERFGSLAKPAIPQLIAMFEPWDRYQPDLPSQASRTLAAIGRESVPALVAVLQSNRRDAWYWAIESLKGIGPEASAAVPDLVRILRVTDYEAQFEAADALASIGAAAVTPLVEILEDQSLRPRIPYEYDPRELAAYALGEIGPDAENAIPSLQALVYYADVRASVESALAKIGPKGQASLIGGLNSD
jgi:HEAT repeat protein